MNKLYISAHNELKTKQEWYQWAIRFYKDIGYKKLPTNWFEKITNVLKLSEVIK